MKISILLLTKNAGDRLEDLLKRLVSQRDVGKREILAIDSGSRDGTKRILESYSIKVTSIEPASFNHGETRNMAGREADPGSDYLVYLSQDAIPADEHWLANLIRPLEDDPQVAGVFSRHIPPPGTSPSLVRQLTTMWQTGGTERLVEVIPDDLEHYERDKFIYINLNFLPRGEEKNSPWGLGPNTYIKNVRKSYRYIRSH